MEPIYSPVKDFENIYKEKHENETKKLFDKLIQTSKINISENESTITKLKNKQGELDKKQSKLKAVKFLRFLLITLVIASFLITILFSVNAATEDLIKSVNKTVSIVIAVIVGLVGIGIIVFLFMFVRKRRKNVESKINDLKKKIDDLINKAQIQMRPLNNLFNSLIPIELFRQTLPTIKIDNYFDIKKFDFMSSKYGLKELSQNESTLYVQSGEIVGNPFLIIDKLKMEIHPKVYTGTLTISWTEEIRDFDGKTKTISKSEVLTASITKPAPFYDEYPYLIYSNEAAPDLSFSREINEKIANASEKKLTKFIDKKGNKLDKESRKAIAKGKDFISMSNKEFEVLFNALNRDNEKDFRLLFTPLAQQNMVELLKDHEVGYGDSFDFIKNKYLNYIYPQHLQLKDLNIKSDDFVHFDYHEIEKRFYELNTNYFKSLYFTLAPILAIPLYQEYKPSEYIYKDVYSQRYSSYQNELLANLQNPILLNHSQSITNNIYKTRIINNTENYDELEIKAHGFKGINRIEYVPTSGGDGHIHEVPVHWVEYIPVVKTTNMFVKELNDFNDNKLSNNLYSNDKFNEFIKRKNINSSNFSLNRNIFSVLTNEDDIDFYDELNDIIDDINNKKGDI